MAVAVGDQRRRKEAMELLVNELSKGDEESIMSSLRTALERGWLKSFPDCLEDAKKKKETEIDRICSRHYADFLNSVNEMLKMKGSAIDLTKLVKTVHNKFYATNDDLLRVLSDLKKIQRERENTQKLLEMSVTCKEITVLMLEVKKEIENDNHYHAMRVIESIQKELSLNPSLLPMRKTLELWLPIAINKLLYAARSDADNFLNDLRSNKMKLIGQTILAKQAKILIRNEETVYSLHQALISLSNNGSSVAGYETPSISIGANAFNQYSSIGSHHESRDYSVVNTLASNHNSFYLPTKYSITTKYLLQHVNVLYKQSISGTTSLPYYLFPLPLNLEECVSYHFEPALPVSTEGINLLENYFIYEMSSIHKVLHLYAILGNLQNYYDYYSYNRYEVFKTKLLRNLEKNISSNGLLTSIQIYLEELIGFFMIEIMIYRLIENNSIYFHSKELEKLWEETIQEFQRICAQFAITLHSPNELIQIKEEIILILFIILDHNIFYANWNISLLLKMVLSLWDLFDALQIQSLQQNIFHLLSKASFQPYQITDYNSFFLQIKFFQLDSIELQEETFVNGKFAVPYPSLNGANGTSSNPLNRRNSLVLPTKREPMSLNRLEANLDALEQELNISNLHSGGTSSQQGSGGGGGGVSGLSPHLEPSRQSSYLLNNSDFLPQTYPFSEFVPLIMRELHLMLVRLLVYGTIPIPERQNKNFMSEIYKIQSIQSVKFDSLSVDDFSSLNRGKNNKAVVGSGGGGGEKHDPYRQKNEALQTGVEHSQNQQHHSMKQTIQSSSSLYHCIQECRFYEKICISVKSYYHYLISVLSQELTKDGMETVLSKAAQIYLDSSALSLTTNYFYHHLVVESLVQIYGKEQLDLSWIEMIYTDIITMIRKVMNQGQDLIFELLSNKIDILLESSLLFINLEPETFTINANFLANNQNNYQFNLNNLVHNLNLDQLNAFLVHENIESIIEFLKITFMCLTHLPKTIRETVYYVSCYKLSNGLIDFLLSSKVSRINIFGIVSLDADCKKLIQFAESCGIIHLRECFDELSQMVNALLSPDLSSFGDNYYLRNSLYPRLNVLKFANLLEKITPSPIIAQSLNLPRLEKVMTRGLAKKLRSQPQISRDLNSEILL